MLLQQQTSKLQSLLQFWSVSNNFLFTHHPNTQIQMKIHVMMIRVHRCLFMYILYFLLEVIFINQKKNITYFMEQYSLCKSLFQTFFLQFILNWFHYRYLFCIFSLNFRFSIISCNKVKYQSMNNDDIYQWIVSHGNNYPGKHLSSQPRTSSSLKNLDPKAQFHLVFKGLGEYMRENVSMGRGINYRGFGAFAFEVQTDLVKPAQLSNFDITKDLESQREERMHNHKIRPCFVPDKTLQEQLIRYPGKEQINKPKSQHSIYQKGFGMVFCNPVPIANSCSFSKEVTEACMAAFAQAVKDLTSLGKTLEIKIGPITIKIVNRNLTYNFNSNFSLNLNVTPYEKELKKSLKQTKSHWTDSYQQNWQKSNLGSLIEKPDDQEVGRNYENGLGLKIMSLDFNSTEKVYKNQNK